MFRLRTRRPRKPRVYRIPIETYLIALALAFALSVAFYPAMLDAIARARSSINLESSSDDVAALRTAGCVVEFFHPLRPWMLDTINNTHRRLLVVDGRIGRR
jgi:hypothetical protein